jgi:hypothetical protein
MHRWKPIWEVMSRRSVLLAILSIAAAGLGGCGPQIVYDFIPPGSSEGRICAAQCQSTATSCRQMKQMVNQQCQNNYSAMQQNYNACKASGAKHCVGPTPCPYHSTRECDQNYRECFAA